MKRVVLDWVGVGDGSNGHEIDIDVVLFRGELPAPGCTASVTQLTIKAPGVHRGSNGAWPVLTSGCAVADFDVWSVYVAQLMERDMRRELDGSLTDAYRCELDAAWTEGLFSSIELAEEERRRKLVQAVTTAFRCLPTVCHEVTAERHWIGAPVELNPVLRRPTTVDFTGDGGLYRFRVEVAA